MVLIISLPPCIHCQLSCPFLFICFNWNHNLGYIKFFTYPHVYGLEWLYKNIQPASCLKFMIINLRREIISTFHPICSLFLFTRQPFPTFLKPPTPHIPSSLSMTLNDWEKWSNQIENHLTPGTPSTYLITVDWCILKPSLRASSISTTGERVRNANNWMPLQTYWIKFWGWGPAIYALVGTPGDSDEA